MQFVKHKWWYRQIFGYGGNGKNKSGLIICFEVVRGAQKKFNLFFCIITKGKIIYEELSNFR